MYLKTLELFPFFKLHKCKGLAEKNEKQVLIFDKKYQFPLMSSVGLYFSNFDLTRSESVGKFLFFPIQVYIIKTNMSCHELKLGFFRNYSRISIIRFVNCPRSSYPFYFIFYLTKFQSHWRRRDLTDYEHNWPIFMGKSKSTTVDAA